MAIYVLDTDTLSLLQTNNELVRTGVQGARSANHIVALNIVTVEEQFDGWVKAHRVAKNPKQYARASRNLASTVAMWAGFLIYPQTESSLARLDQLGRQKLNVKKNDLRIASIVLDIGAILVTRNTIDFRRVPGLSFVDWAAPPGVAAPTPPPVS